MSFKRAVVVALSAMALAAGSLTPQVAAKQSDVELRRRIEALERTQQQIVKELQDLKRALQGRGASPQPTAAPAAGPEIDLAVSLAGSPVKGRADAKLVILEYSDFECPFCGKYSRETYPQVVKEFVDTGVAQYVYRHYPLERLHPNAVKAAQAAECAFVQGKFWEMHDRLFANQQQLALPQLLAHGNSVGVSAAPYASCLNSGGTLARVKADQDAGARAGVTGTPGFFIGQRLKNGQVRLLRRFKGATQISTFRTMINAVLAMPIPKG